MENLKRLKQLDKQIIAIKKKLGALGEMRPGSLSEQFSRCGTPNCKCQDKKNPEKHGPYYQLSYVHKGKSTSQFIAKHSLSDVRQQIKNYKEFKTLTEDWVSLSIEYSKLKMQIKRDRAKSAGQ